MSRAALSAGLSAVSNEHLKILSYCYTIKESNEMKAKKSERTVAFSAVIIFISLLFASCQTELIPEPEMEKIQSSTGGKNVQIEAPLTVKASHGRTKTVTVSWSTSNGATQYLIYSAESPHSEFVQIAETKGEASSIDIQEPAGTSAYYKVRAKNYEGTISSFSNVVFGSTMATPIISNITSNADGSASTVTWWMENCSASTYRDSVKYIVYCYDESGKEVTHAEASGAKTSAVLSGLTAKTRYIYQVEAYVESDQSNPELSDKVDEETARRLIPDAPEKLSAEKGTDKNAVSIRWTLPQFCDVAVSGGVYERHPLYFTIERKLKNEDDSTYEKIVSYLGTEKEMSGTSVLQFSCNEEDMEEINKKNGISVQLPPQSDADAERSSNYPRYVSHSVITYCDSTAERGKQYIYRVQSYVDDVKRTVSAETAAATAEGFLLSKPTFSASAVYNYQKDQDGKNTNAISSIKVSFKTTFEPFGQDYSYLVYRHFTPMKQDGGTETGAAEDRLLVSASSSSTLNTETDVFDFNNKNFNIGYYQYTLYICAPGESEVTNAYDSITTGGKITVIDDASKLPSITMFQIKDGYADHFNIKWNYDENCRYKLEWKSSDDDFEEQHSLELADGEYSVNGDTAEYNHTAQSGEGRIYIITAYMGIEVSRTYPLSEGDETREPEKLYTLGTVRPKTTDIGYRAISVSWEPVAKADGTYTVQAYYEDDADKSNELSDGKCTVTKLDGTYSCTITDPAGFDNPARSGLPIIMEITAKNAGTGATTVARHTVRTLGPAAVDARANEEPESDVISVTWNKAEGAVGYLIRRLSYEDNSCETVERAVTYYCTLEGGESVEVLGDYETDPNAGEYTRALIESTGETLTLKDYYREPTTAESAYQESQSKLSWGRPYGYVVLPVKDGADFTFNEDSSTLSDGSAVDYTVNGRTLSETIGSTLGYGLNLVAAKAEKAREQGIKWVAPYKPLLPVVYRRAAGSGDAFVKFSDNQEMQDKTDVILQIRDSYYDAFEYIVKYYKSYDDVAMEIEVASSDKDGKTIMPPSLLAEISRHVQNYDTPQGTMMELDNKGYLLTVSGFNAQCHPKESYYEQLLWDDWNYGKRAVGPDKMVFSVQNNNIDAEYHELVTVSKAKAYSGIDVHGDDVVAEAEASNSIRVAPKGIVEGTSGTTNGMLKVLRDYKHTYILKLKRGDHSVSYSDYEQDGEKTAWRELTAEELLIVSMDTIRSSFKKKWYTTMNAWGNLDSYTFNGTIEGTCYTGIDRNGFTGTNYRRYQRFADYTDSFVKVNGTMMKDNGGGVASNQYPGTWLHKGSNWPSDSNFNPRTDYLTVSLTYFNEEYEGQIKLNNINIDNNDKNAPKWVSGTFEVTYNAKTESFDNQQIPFGFLMDDETFYNKVEEMCY